VERQLPGLVAAAATAIQALLAVTVVAAKAKLIMAPMPRTAWQILVVVAAASIMALTEMEVLGLLSFVSQVCIKHHFLLALLKQRIRQLFLEQQL